MTTGNPGLWGIGAVFIIVGLASRDKWRERRAWSDLSPVEQRTKLLLMLGLGVLLAIGLAFFLWRGRGS